MTSLIVRIYNWMTGHKTFRLVSAVVIVAILASLLVRQTYKEDISDFLPLNNKYNKALKVYQGISKADRLIAIFEYGDSTESAPDSIVAAVEHFVQVVQENDRDGMVKDLTFQVDYEKVSSIVDFVYGQIPFFLTDADYHRFDSLMGEKDFVSQQIANDKQMLTFPVSALMSENFQRDPLNFFTPVVERLQNGQPEVVYENYDGLFFSPDMRCAMVMMTSPFGTSETEKNTRLLEFLKTCALQTTARFANLQIRFTGGPAIAVGNSSQIKKDSLFSVALAVCLIVLLLFMVFRSAWNLLLIILSIAWGWLFAMGALALIHDSISVIVIGISSVILGIAVNYPLHLIAHMQHTPDIRTTLKEIAMPLVVGNITTVGAFLTLVPLKSVALRDLGLFSSMLLIGTILFVLLYLPHLVRVGRHQSESHFLSRIGNVSLESNRWVVGLMLVLTVFFGYYSLQTSFDSDMNHINYLSEEQSKDLRYLQEMMVDSAGSQNVYVVSSDSTMEGALEKSRLVQPVLRELEKEGYIQESNGCSQFLCSREEQARRLRNWEAFVGKYGDRFKNEVRAAARKEGFADDTFEDFFNILDADFEPHEISYFDLLASTAFSSYLSADSVGRDYRVVDVLRTDSSNVQQVVNMVEEKAHGQYAFDVGSMNSSIATRLSDDFNYIGWACGLIVFFFLWFSLGSLELAMLSFLPMALSWIWILGIMALLNIHFNVVNIILATFIFGQGDDYTIFMTEGCQYEYAYRRRMLSSYKTSIIISALIMFIGIGTLIFAKHPALHSLAEVTIVGMFSVVLMAYVFPPLIYKWLISKKDGYRERPISLAAFGVTAYCAVVFFTQLFSVYVLGGILFGLLKPNSRTKRFFHEYVRRCFWFDMNRIAGVKFTYENKHEETFSDPAIVICNHQSMLDTAYLMAVSSKISIVANEHASQNRIIRKVFKWLDFYTIPDGGTIDESRIRQLVSQGYSVLIFPEGERNPSSSILRFHKGAFYLAEKCGLDIVPIHLHGINHVFPRNTICTYPGEVTLRIGKRISHEDLSWGQTYVERTKSIQRFFDGEFEMIRRKKETATYFARFVADRYRYKGIEISSAVSRRLSKYDRYEKWISNEEDEVGRTAIVVNNHWGEMSLLMAVVCPKIRVIALEEDDDKIAVASYSAESVAPNLSIRKKEGEEQVGQLMNEGGNSILYIIEPSDKDLEIYSHYHPVIIG